MTESMDQPACPQCGLLLPQGEEQCPHCARLQDEATATSMGTTPAAAVSPIIPPGPTIQQSALLPPPLISASVPAQSTGKPVELIIVIVLLFLGAFSGLIIFISSAFQLAMHMPSPLLPIGVFHLITALAMSMALVNLVAKTVFGFGLLRLSSWARTATIYGLVVLCLLGSTLQAYNTFIMKKSMQQMMSSMNVPTSSGSPMSSGMPSSIMQMAVMGSIIFSLLLAFIYTAALIFLLCRPKVVQAFDG